MAVEVVNPNARRDVRSVNVKSTVLLRDWGRDVKCWQMADQLVSSMSTLNTVGAGLVQRQAGRVQQPSDNIEQVLLWQDLL
jgi:hypothetical protein